MESSVSVYVQVNQITPLKNFSLFFSENYTLFTSECSKNCDLGTNSTVTVQCEQWYAKDIPFYKCKRNLLVDQRDCVNPIHPSCTANYGDYTEYTPCKGSCMKQLDESLFERRTRTRVCQSKQNECSEENGKEEVQLCQNPTLCPLQEYNPSTSALAGKKY